MRWVVAAVLRAVLLGVLWLAWSGAGREYVGYGVVAVIVATAVSLAVLPPGPVRPATWARRTIAWITLAGWFGWQSVRGGVDVALRALRRTPDIAPEVFDAPQHLPTGDARQLAMVLMNLMPGSMVQRIGDERVELHTLAAELSPVRQWEELNRRVGAAFGEPSPLG